MPYRAPDNSAEAIFFPKANNFVKFVFAQECDADWWIYVETFVPAFLKLALTVTLLDFDDIIRGRADRIIADNRRAVRRRGGKFRRAKVQVRPVVHQRYNSRQLQFLMKITEPIQKVGFRWLLYAASEQFFADWQMIIERSGECGWLPDKGPLTRSREFLRQGVLPGGQPIFATTVETNRSGWPNTPSTVAVDDGRYMVTVAVELVGPQGGIGGVHARVVSTIGGIDNIVDGPEVEIQEGQTQSCMVNAFMNVPSFFGATFSIELVGPAVPVGLESPNAFWSVSRVDGVIGI